MHANTQPHHRTHTQGTKNLLTRDKQVSTKDSREATHKEVPPVNQFVSC